MKDELNLYRPAVIEFPVNHDGSNVPETLGKFETPEEMSKFLGGNLTVVNTALTCNRYLDNKEKKDLDEECLELLKTDVPVYARKLNEADNALASAKKALKDAQERYDAEIAKLRDLSAEAKKGIREINLDEKYTFRIPYKGNYYFFTWMDKILKLCLIRPIPDYEKQDLYNASAGNEEWIDKNFEKTVL